MTPAAVSLPELTSGYRLADSAIESFRRDGHVLLRAVCSPDEIAAYRPALLDATDRYNTETRPMGERDTYGKAFLQVMNLWTHDDSVRRFVFASRFARIAAQLMGVDAVRLYHDQALFKEPGGGHTPWHQDFYYWPLDTDKTVTMWMPLVSADEQMGTMTFASRSHLEGYLGALEIGDESEEYFNRLVRDRAFPLSQCGAMAAGDATFHTGATLHCAPGNTGTAVREVMTVIYFADGVRAMQRVDNKNRMRDLEAWLPGVRPGDPAVSALNPLLYDARSE